MKKFYYWFCLILLPFFSGCSWLSELMLFNKSSETLVVRIELSEHDTIRNPMVIKGYSILKWEDSIPSLGDPVNIYSRREGYVYYVELPANMALNLAEGVNLDLRDAQQRKNMMSRVMMIYVELPNDSEYKYTGTECAERSIALSRARAGVVIEN